MHDVAIGSDARARIARLGFEDGLVVLVFGLYFLFDGLISWIGSEMPPDTIRFDIFNLRMLQVAVVIALAIGMKRAKSRLVAPRVGYAKPRPVKWYYIAARYIGMGVQGRVPRLTWLGVAIALIGVYAYLAHVGYPELRMAMGGAATIAGALQFRDFLGTHRIAELEHA